MNVAAAKIHAGGGGALLNREWVTLGNPKLLTLKAVRCLGLANAVLVDALVDCRVLTHARPGARIVAAGKRGRCRSTSQRFIARMLVRFAHQGLQVVRLKRGDPFVLDRGGEEAQLAARSAHPFTAPAVIAFTRCRSSSE